MQLGVVAKPDDSPEEFEPQHHTLPSPHAAQV
jgi:hypothetical protein